MAMAISAAVKLPVAVTTSRMRARSRGSSGRMRTGGILGEVSLTRRRLRGRPRHGLDGDGGDRGAVVEIDVLHRIVAVVIAVAVDVVVFHEQHGGYPGIGEDLAVGVVERAVRIDLRPHLAAQLR